MAFNSSPWAARNAASVGYGLVDGFVVLIENTSRNYGMLILGEERENGGMDGVQFRFGSRFERNKRYT
jgi:hypothetical protein